MLIDRSLPSYDVSWTAHRVIAATPEETWAAVRRLDLARSLVGRAVAWVRLLPARVRRLGRKEVEAPAAPRAGFEELKQVGWALLGEEPQSEIVVGFVAEMRRPGIAAVRVEPGDFAGFAKDGHVKTAIALSIREYGPGRSLLTFEWRSRATDDAGRARFRRLWSVLAPAAALLGYQALALVQSDAEHGRAKAA